MTDAPATTSQECAAQAMDAVVSRFGERLLGLPGTHLARTRRPSTGPLDVDYKYWWQAHYVDCLVDAGWRRHRAEDQRGAAEALALAERLVRTVWLRTGMRYVVAYYDDMAWMALAAHRLDGLAVALTGERSRIALAVGRAVTPELESACTDDLAGGMFWHRDRDFKNAPATAPSALFFARAGQGERASVLIEWIYANLLNPDGLIMDGIRMRGAETELVAWIFTYNQGTVLGALLELGDEGSLLRAEALIAAVDEHLRVETPVTEERPPILKTHGDDDGGLFTGILMRYLARAAGDPRLSDGARRCAAALVQATADAWWEGSASELPGHGPQRVFSPVPATSAAAAFGTDMPLEFSPQLQAWMGLEAAASLAR